MKKLLLLLLSIPLFSLAQEANIGVKVYGVWNYDPHIISEANNALISYGITTISFDSVSLQNDSTLNLFGHDSSNIFTDRMIVRATKDSIFTSPETMTGCFNTCMAIGECVGGCYKSYNCDCKCDYGGCLSINTAYSGIGEYPSFGAVLREYLILSYDLIIPER
jgi:hypothetical protein